MVRKTKEEEQADIEAAAKINSKIVYESSDLSKQFMDSNLTFLEKHKILKELIDEFKAEKLAEIKRKKLEECLV